MAEARQGVMPIPSIGLHENRIDATSHKVQFVIDRSGFFLYIPSVRFLLRNILRTIWRTRNKIRELCHPFPSWSLASLNVCSIVFSQAPFAEKYTPRNSFFDLNSSAFRIIHVCLKSFFHRLPNSAVRGMASITFSSAYFLAIAATQRFIIRSLLSYDGWVYESRAKTSLRTKIWFFLLKTFYVRPRGALFFQFQNCLPKQPLPDLNETVATYLEYIEPLVSGEEFNSLRVTANRFVQEEGRTLQRYLKFRHLCSSNYVSDWWLNLVYLRSRRSLTINSNYYGMGPTNGVPTQNQVSRAAVIIHALVKVKLGIDHETIPPQCVQGVVPICMDQHKFTFSSVREPHLVQDKLVRYDSRESRHVVILHKGKMYTVSCFSQNSRRPLTAKQLEMTLKGIVEDTSEANPIEAALPILTSLDRNQWAIIRQKHFQEDVMNEIALDKIEKALFLVSLDDFVPTNIQEEGLNLFIGNYGKNRWVDKSFTLVVTANAKAGIEAEHSWGDAVAMGYTLELAFTEELRTNPYERDGSVRRVQRDILKGDKSQYAAERIRFNLSPELCEMVTKAIPVVRDELQDLNLVVDVFTEYGKEFIKRAKCSPDCWVQMALQLAYFRDQSKFEQTYESSTLRRFYKGRTETIRSVSKASCAFVLAMQDATQTPEIRAKLLRAACDQHQKFTHSAFLGKGIDRHLFALYVTSVGMGIQSPFLSSMINRKWSLSTSQTPSRQTLPWTWPENDQGNLFPSAVGGFAPVADDGYGVSYSVVGDFRIFFHVSSKYSAENTCSQRFLDTIIKALRDMRKLFPDIPDMPLPEKFVTPYEKHICLDDLHLSYKKM